MPRTRLPENVIFDPVLRDRTFVFRDREEGGQALARLVKSLELPDPVVLAIPAGGAPVAAAVARALSAPLDLLIARKLQIPWNTEAGFGACTVDGPVFMNRELVERLGLSEDEIKEAERKARENLRKREALFRGQRPFPRLQGRDVIIVDDGLASGYTMLAAINRAKMERPSSLTAAAPTGHENSALRIARHCDFVVCPNLRGGYSFAVADAYQRWYDLDDEEVLAILASAGVKAHEEE